MKFKLQMVIYDEDDRAAALEDIIELDKSSDTGYCAGISLLESKQILKVLQQNIVLKQAQNYIASHKLCPSCFKQLKVKGYHNIQYKTLFGTIVIPSPRLYECKNCSCDCDASNNNDDHSTTALNKTFSVLKSWLLEHTSPELQYIESKWASYMSYDKTADLLHDVLPIHASINSSTIRNHLFKVAQKQELELENKPMCISGCGNEWAKLPKPDKPLIVGIDGGYVRGWKDKKSNFEVIVGKSFSKTQSAKRFGLVQTLDEKPQRRLLHLLNEQGMQANQQITFLSDGADNVRDLQYIMHPEAEHILDWFHITKRITVLNQFAKGMVHSDPEEGAQMREDLESIKWYLWHGNVEKSLEHLEECYLVCEYEETKYEHRKKFQFHLEELSTYIENNRHLIPNYGERWRNGEYIASSFVESAVNEVISKRMVKKQQMQWSAKGAHYLLQVRTATLNQDLHKHFERWYPGLKIQNHNNDKNHSQQKKMAA